MKKKPDQKHKKYYQGHIFLDKLYLEDIHSFIKQLEAQIQSQFKEVHKSLIEAINDHWRQKGTPAQWVGLKRAKRIIRENLKNHIANETREGSIDKN